MNRFQQRYQEWGHTVDQIELPRTIRINTLVTSKEQLEKRLQAKLEKIPYLPQGFYISSSFNATSSTEYLLGHFYFQEAASQLPAIVLDPQPDEVVFDLCAAPGSKTTQLAALMNNKGNIVSVENNYQRIKKLRNNIERCQISNVTVLNLDVKYIEDVEIQADKILLDAPCSGNCVIEKDWFKKRTLADIKKKSDVQKELLQTAFEVLKPGGVLVYSTCSLEIEENEDVIEWALEHLPVSLEPIEIPHLKKEPGLTENTKECLRMWPDTHKTQGFFIAKLKKI